MTFHRTVRKFCRNYATFLVCSSSVWWKLTILEEDLRNNEEPENEDEQKWGLFSTRGVKLCFHDSKHVSTIKVKWICKEISVYASWPLLLMKKINVLQKFTKIKAQRNELPYTLWVFLSFGQVWYIHGSALNVRSFICDLAYNTDQMWNVTSNYFWASSLSLYLNPVLYLAYCYI